MNTQNTLVKEYMTDALLMLMETRPYDSISITEITKKAGVSRMAFYRNYEVKDDIIDDYFKVLLSDLTAHFQQKEHTHDENLMDFLELIRTSKPVLRALIASNASYLIYRNYEAIIKEIILDHYKLYHASSIPTGYQLDFFIGGLLQVILSWAKKEENEEDSELEKLFLNLELFIQP